jgi:DNA-binding transcriptional ArsR family regulator
VSTMRLLLVHPAREDLSLPTILYALGDTLRLQIVAQLAMVNDTDEKMACQDFHTDETVAKSTLSFHFKILREAGLIRMVPQGRRVLVSLRTEDLETRFPGLLEAVLHTYHQQDSKDLDDSSQ